MMIGTQAKRRFKTVKTSRIAAPVADVIMPIRFGINGKGFLCMGSNNPAAAH